MQKGQDTCPESQTSEWEFEAQSLSHMAALLSGKLQWSV